MPKPLPSVSRAWWRIRRSPLLLLIAGAISWLVAIWLDQLVHDESVSRWLAGRGWPSVTIIIGTALAVFTGIIVIAGVIIWVRGKSDIEGEILAAWRDDRQHSPSRMSYHITLKVYLVNKGEETDIGDYQFEYTVGDGPGTTGIREELAEFKLRKPRDMMIFSPYRPPVMEDLRDLYLHRGEPIGRNRHVEGYLRFRVRGHVRPAGFPPPPPARIKLIVVDAPGDTCTISSHLPPLLSKAEGTIVHVPPAL